MKRIRSKRILTGNDFFDGYVYHEAGKIKAVTQAELPHDETLDCTDCMVSAGFIDTHVHGGCGVDFTFCSADDVAQAADFHLSHGTTSILPTTLASDRVHTEEALRALQTASTGGKTKANIIGAHIEGPYFARTQAGAQNPRYLTDPVAKDYQCILSQFGGFVKKWSYAPERDHNAAFCRYITECGVVASAGHTAATYKDFCAAYEAGLRSVTHLYSCTSTITRENGFRKLGVTECAYLYDDVYAELIADGRHIPPELIRLVFRQKGAEHIVLVTDCLSIAGSDNSSGQLNGIPFIVEDHVAKLTDRSAFAGSVATMDFLIKECVASGVSLPEAVRAATATPAALLGVSKGKIAVGYDADFVVLDDPFAVKKVIVSGETVYQAIESK